MWATRQKSEGQRPGLIALEYLDVRQNIERTAGERIVVREIPGCATGNQTLLRGIVQAADVRPGAVVLDVGVSRVTDPQTGKSKVVGDVDPAVAEVASWISPNPGGVGPMTRAMLLVNVVEAAERAAVN